MLRNTNWVFGKLMLINISFTKKNVFFCMRAVSLKTLIYCNGLEIFLYLGLYACTCNIVVFFFGGGWKVQKNILKIICFLLENENNCADQTC